MADFPPNLDDGELWLPSDIFPDEVVSSSNISPKFPSELTYMEDLAQQLASYALLEQRNQNIISKPPPPNLVINCTPEQQSRYGTVPVPQTRFGFGFGEVFHGGGGVGHRHYASSVNDGFRVGFSEVYRYHPMHPAQAQVENFLFEARVLQRLQQKQKQKQNQNHFLPFQVNGRRSMGGFVRESGGTGVFLPRVSINHDVVKKKHGVKKGEEVANKHRQATTKKAVVEKHEGFQSSPEAEVRLPQDWTY